MIYSVYREFYINDSILFNNVLQNNLFICDIPVQMEPIMVQFKYN